MFSLEKEDRNSYNIPKIRKGVCRMDQRRNSPRSLTMMISSMLIFGTIGIFRKMIPLPSALIAFCRGMIGSACLTLFVFLRGKRTMQLELPQKTSCLLALSGALIGVNWILLFEAYNYTSVSVATLCYYMEPTFVVILSTLLFREKLTGRKVVCTVLALIGMVLISGVAESGASVQGEPKGILLGLAAACLYSAVVLLNKWIHGVDPYPKTIIQLASAAVVMIPYLLLTGEFTGNTWSAGTIGLMILVGVIHTGLSYALYFASLDGLQTQTVAIFSYIDPITALVLSALILHEKLSLIGIIGAVLILGSAIVSELPSGSLKREERCKRLHG